MLGVQKKRTWKPCAIWRKMHISNLFLFCKNIPFHARQRIQVIHREIVYADISQRSYNISLITQIKKKIDALRNNVFQ